MREKIHYAEVFKAVEKAVEANAVQLQCSECGQGFYKITWVGIDEPDYIIEEGLTYNCSDHILYDLFVNPEVTQTVIVSGQGKHVLGRKVSVAVRKVDAQLFISNRHN